MVVHRKKLGYLAEQQACQFLQAKGLKLITQNYRSILGEIDLIMRDGEDIVFVEVRSRAKNYYGSAIETINKNKQKKILETSLFFLQQRNWLNKVNCRFDVIGINHDHLEWIQDAFTADIL
ncbi:MAG TPA: YraN family protein [Gammaproteobacteria bacterium]|nr:YraN family protein [Gammaproteobacteria bacterium]